MKLSGEAIAQQRGITSQTRICPLCGATYIVTDNYCARCGKQVGSNFRDNEYRWLARYNKIYCRVCGKSLYKINKSEADDDQV